MQTNHPFLLVGRSDNIEAFSVNHPIGYALETIAEELCPGNEPNDAMTSVLESLHRSKRHFGCLVVSPCLILVLRIAWPWCWCLLFVGGCDLESCFSSRFSRFQGNLGIQSAFISTRISSS